MVKKKGLIITTVIVLVLAAALFLPIQRATYNDGGTRVYGALAYKTVVWNRIIDESNEKDELIQGGIYHKTSVFWFPDSLKSIDKLWEMERAEANSSAQKVDDAISEDDTYSNVIDSATFDIDNDGIAENCTISFGPTSGLFTVVITASTDEGVKYKNTFLLDCYKIKFGQENGVAKVLLTYQDSQTGAKTEEIYDISIKDKGILVENADKSLPYWGDGEWNWN